MSGGLALWALLGACGVDATPVAEVLPEPPRVVGCVGFERIGGRALGGPDARIEDLAPFEGGVAVALSAGETGEVVLLGLEEGPPPIRARLDAGGPAITLAVDGAALLVGRMGAGLGRVRPGGPTENLGFAGESVVGLDLEGDRLLVATDQQRVVTLGRAGGAGAGWEPVEERILPHRFLPSGLGRLGDAVLVPIYYHGRMVLFRPGSQRIHALAGSATSGGERGRVRRVEGAVLVPLPAVGLQRWSADGTAQLLLRADPGAWDVAPLGDSWIVALGEAGVAVVNAEAACDLGGKVTRITVVDGFVAAAVGARIEVLRARSP